MEVELLIRNEKLKGILEVPSNASCLIVFAHGSGSSRLSPRNLFVASELNRAGYATLLFDLLTEDEEKCPVNKFALSPKQCQRYSDNYKNYSRVK